MKVALLAAGRSMRMWPVTDKNFVEFLGVPLLERQLASLKRAGFKEILVIAGAHNTSRIKKIAPKVRVQRDLDLGMAGAILAASSWIGADPFLLVSAHDFIDETVYAAVKDALRQKQGFLVAKQVDSYFPGGYLKVDRRGLIQGIVEKPKPGHEPSDLVNIVLHHHAAPRALLEKLRSAKSETDDIYEKCLQSLIDDGVEFRVVRFSGFWQPLKYPWHVRALSEHLLHQISAGISKGKKVAIAPSATIYGAVTMGDGVKILDNAVIVGPTYIGPRTVIATNALVRESHIGAHCVIGFGTEVARSHLGDNVWTHTNYIGDSVIGSDVSFGAGTVTGNVRFDEGNIQVLVRKKWNGVEETARIDTGMNKCGLLTGDHIRTGINSSFMPGVKIGSNSCIGPGIILSSDIPDGSFVSAKSSLQIVPNRVRITPRGTPVSSARHV